MSCRRDHVRSRDPFLDGQMLRITGIKDGSLIKQWNTTTPTKQVKVMDMVVAANGMDGSVDVMAGEIRRTEIRRTPRSCRASCLALAMATSRLRRGRRRRWESDKTSSSSSPPPSSSFVRLIEMIFSAREGGRRGWLVLGAVKVITRTQP